MDWSLFGFKSLALVFNVHPAFVHFPIALIPASALFYFLGRVLNNDRFYFAGRVSLYAGFVSTVIAVVTGLRAQDSFPHNETIHHMMGTHETIGWTILAATAVLSLWSFWNHNQKPRLFWIFLIILSFGTYLVLQNGDIGSRMVYIEGAAVKPAVKVIAEPEEQPADEAAGQDHHNETQEDHHDHGTGTHHHHHHEK